MTKKIISGAAACLLLGTAAQADLIRLDFAGATTSSHFTGTNNIFGQAAPRVSGYIVYDDTVSGTPFGVENDNWERLDHYGAIQEVEFTFEDADGNVLSTANRTGNYGRIQTWDRFSFGSDTVSLGNIDFYNNQIAGEPDGITRYSLTFGLSGPTDAFGEEALGFDPDNFTNYRRVSFFSAGLGGQGIGVSALYNFDLFTRTNLDEPADVPAPPALALLGLGLAGAAGLRRRTR
ncbi:PEP-CTERM sorting domain-containing protein [Pacificimonas flava]|uniref:Ice-binding protein C-terminal domain-containing protein n=1 Tax=Pacificimonas flava TaxID=1234595 RepID=M2TDF4_9SPHN|nr:PEP-CTERM sorting domain-containing protein [Pacificimonas flava]EMD84539.1 hypothetical protein C725_0469 [Pacificimonas flava]MBB5279589.1 hypothetical protein [Pacificimonas flava]